MLIVVLISIFSIPLVMSIVSIILYPSSVQLFLKRWSPKNKYYRVFLKYWVIGFYMHTAYGAGVRRSAGIKDSIWKDLLAVSAISLFLALMVKILTG